MSEPLRRRAHREDHCVGGEDALGRLDAERALRQIDARRILLVDARAEARRLRLEAIHHLGARYALRKAGIVLDVGGQHELTAGHQARDRRRVRVRRAPRRARRSSPPARCRRSAAARVRRALRERCGTPSSASSSPLVFERGEVVESADVAIPDPDLRHGAAAAALDHLVAARGLQPRCRSRSRSVPSTPASAWRCRNRGRFPSSRS